MAAQNGTGRYSREHRAMGAEFIRKAAKTFRKGWDDGRKQLGTANLFTIEPTCVGRSAPFDLTQNVALSEGETVTVEEEGAALVVRKRLTEVARTNNPPTELWRAVHESCGIAQGTIEHIHTVAGVAEISLC